MIRLRTTVSITLAGEIAPQVAETDQKSYTLVDNRCHVCVPAEVTIEKNTKVSYYVTLMNGLPTHPYADRR